MMILLLLFTLFFINALVALTQEFSWLGGILLATGLAYIAYEFLPWASILPVLLIVAVTLVASLFWKVPRFVVFGISAIAVAISIAVLWWFGGVWIFELWTNDANNHWFGLVILSSFSVVGLILATGILLPVTNGLAMVSMVDID